MNAINTQTEKETALQTLRELGYLLNVTMSNKLRDKLEDKILEQLKKL